MPVRFPGGCGWLPYVGLCEDEGEVVLRVFLRSLRLDRCPAFLEGTMSALKQLRVIVVDDGMIPFLFR